MYVRSQGARSLRHGTQIDAFDYISRIDIEK